MIIEIRLEDGWHISHNTKGTFVVLTGASDPITIILNMDLTSWMNVAYELAGNYWNGILLVVNMREVNICINVVCEMLIPNLDM
jgi:hypothetical protein